MLKRRSLAVDGQGDVVISGEGSSMLFLPARMDEEFALRWFRIADYDHPCFVGRVIDQVPIAELRRLADLAQMYGGELRLQLHKHARLWPDFTTAARQWDYGDHTFVYRAALPASPVTDVLITDRDVRFAQMEDGRLLSVGQFRVEFGQQLEKHVDDYIDKFAKQAKIVSTVLRSPLRSARVSAVNVGGSVATIEAVGPSALPPAQWELPDGLVFLSED